MGAALPNRTFVFLGESCLGTAAAAERRSPPVVAPGFLSLEGGVWTVRAVWLGDDHGSIRCHLSCCQWEKVLCYFASYPPRFRCPVAT